MNMGDRVIFDAAEGNTRSRNIPYYNETANDEIDLGDLVRNLIREWKTMAVVMAIGVVSAIAIALFQPKIYLIEAMLRIPTANELGDINEQNILGVSSGMALRRVVDQLLSDAVLEDTLERSNWLKGQSETSALDVNQKAKNISNQLSVAVVRHNYYELEKDEKAPFKEINVSLKSSDPEQATKIFRMLIKNAQDKALASFSSDISRIKDTRVIKIQEQLRSLTLAAKQSREAEIVRLQEANHEAVFRLQQQIDMKLRKAIKDRENRIARLLEDLKIATSLGITEPVSWDDLRPRRQPAQVTNEINSKEATVPIYFRGTRLLNAELVLLKNRSDDKPFIAGLTELENQIFEIQNDPKIAALKSRANDMIYVEKYDELQRQLADLIEQPTQFEGAQMAIVTRPALVPTRPMRNSQKIVYIGIILSGFLALIVALIRVSMRNSNLRQNEMPLTD